MASTMQSESSYAFSGTVVVGTSSVLISGRFQAPNRLDEMVQVQGQSPVRALLVGSSTLVQDPRSGAWRQGTRAGSAADPRMAFALLRQVTRVRRSGNVFRFSVPAPLVGQLVPGLRTTGPAQGTAQVLGGVLANLKLEIGSQGQNVTVALHYSSMGGAPPVTLPARVG